MVPTGAISQTEQEPDPGKHQEDRQDKRRVHVHPMTATIEQEALTTIPLALWDPGATFHSLPKEGWYLESTSG